MQIYSGDSFVDSVQTVVFYNSTGFLYLTPLTTQPRSLTVKLIIIMTIDLANVMTSSRFSDSQSPKRWSDQISEQTKGPLSAALDQAADRNRWRQA